MANDKIQEGEKKERIDEARDACLQRIDSIIHHHCGNHKLCHYSHCLYKQIELEIRTATMEENKDDDQK